MEKYDLAIIGAGPAGMSAALFAEGDGLKFRLIEKQEPCGFVEQVINTNFTNLENYLGLYNLSGTQVAGIFRAHLLSRGISIYGEDVSGINLSHRTFQIHSSQGICEATSVILATGTKPKRLEVLGLEGIPNRIHYRADLRFSEYVGKQVLVIGGRNTGAVTAVRLKEQGLAPVIIEKNKTLSVKEKYLRRLRELSIPILANSYLERVFGTGEISKVQLVIDGQRSTMRPIAIFSCVGYIPNNDLAFKLGLKVDDYGYIEVDRRMQTSRDGIFAAGDVNGGVKMIAVASGEGAIAEYYANLFVRQKWKRE